MSGGLLVVGTTSDAGKSVVTAGICRWLRQQRVSVTPFKAQNMSNNSAVVVAPDTAFTAVRERALDLLGDLVEEHLDTTVLWRVIEQGPPADPPFVPPGAPTRPAVG